MPANTPVTELDRRYSDPGGTAVSWPDALEHLRRSTLTWLSTVRGNGCPHVTPVLFVLRDGAAHFATGPGNRRPAIWPPTRTACSPSAAGTSRAGSMSC
nr:pyridoxamine 5'-phosphate oxidase family protein [Sciscionella marina]